MAELAWPDDLGHGTFTGRFGFMDADTHDPDREPDITSATGGTVTITPSIKSVRYTGVSGSMILAARPAKGVIDAEGYLCTMTADGSVGDRGMVFPATDDTDLTPTDWTYTVSIALDGSIRLPFFDVKLPEGSTVDLSVAVPVPASGGTAVVVDTATADRAVQAAAAAEASADRAESYAPTFTWAGTALSIDGEPAVNLRGPQGPAGTPGTPGTPGAKGEKGDPGADGAQGVQGERGPKGDKGDPGEPGADGADGAQGPKGDKGDKGDPGDTGVATINDLPAGLTFVIVWSGTGWTLGGSTITARPTARTDLTMHAYGGTTAPAFAIAGDLWTEDAGA